MKAPVSKKAKTKWKWTKRTFVAGICFFLYLLSSGPVIKATETGWLPEWIDYIYAPLYYLSRVEWIQPIFFWYIARVWECFPYGYTTI
jgi:hypothetical protein